MIRTYKPSQIADAILAGDIVRETEFVLAFEVERLRAFEAAHKQLQAALDIAIRESDEARAEVERLRKKMREIAEDCESEYPESYKKIAWSIRNALEAKP